MLRFLANEPHSSVTVRLHHYLPEMVPEKKATECNTGLQHDTLSDCEKETNNPVNSHQSRQDIRFEHEL